MLQGGWRKRALVLEKLATTRLQRIRELESMLELAVSGLHRVPGDEPTHVAMKTLDELEVKWNGRSRPREVRPLPGAPS